jgi:hypothetical protein
MKLEYLDLVRYKNKILRIISKIDNNYICQYFDGGELKYIEISNSLIKLADIKKDFILR